MKKIKLALSKVVIGTSLICSTGYAEEIKNSYKKIVSDIMEEENKIKELDKKGKDVFTDIVIGKLADQKGIPRKKSQKLLDEQISEISRSYDELLFLHPCGYKILKGIYDFSTIAGKEVYEKWYSISKSCIDSDVRIKDYIENLKQDMIETLSSSDNDAMTNSRFIETVKIMYNDIKTEINLKLAESKDIKQQKSLKIGLNNLEIIVGTNIENKNGDSKEIIKENEALKNRLNEYIIKIAELKSKKDENPNFIKDIENLKEDMLNIGEAFQNNLIKNPCKKAPLEGFLYFNYMIESRGGLANSIGMYKACSVKNQDIRYAYAGFLMGISMKLSNKGFNPDSIDKSSKMIYKILKEDINIAISGAINDKKTLISDIESYKIILENLNKYF